jgi:L-ribulokinase
MNSVRQNVIGVDYGTDSVRSVLMNTGGELLADSVYEFRRWAENRYCNPARNMFRHHPLDYLDGLEATIKEIVKKVSPAEAGKVGAIAVDTTGSTPVAVDKSGMPLALHEEFAENPNAMFILWKDHTAIQEAEEINSVARSWGGVDYTKYVGGVYSSEWFWAKLLHMLRVDEKVREAAYSWVELCDWVPYELTGGNDIRRMKRSRCAAGHKAMWHREFDGLPGEDFLIRLDPLLSGLRDRLYSDTYTSDYPAGTISKTWAHRLGLPEDVIIGVGAFDAHMGAVGGGIEPYYLCRVMGTSTCDMLVAPLDEVKGILVRGICGQVEGSVIPGMMGMEAGQSAFGDVYAWFRDLLLWPLGQIIRQTDYLKPDQKEKFLLETTGKIIPMLSEAAAKIDVKATDIIALDWLNGRRTPDANQKLKGAIEGLDLGSNAPGIFKALVEATCFGAKLIVDRFIAEGVPIKGIIGMGGVAKKSPYVMQTLADILDMPIRITRSEQTCAAGAAMFAATVAGMYKTVNKAQEAMFEGFDRVYQPDPGRVKKYTELYNRHKSLGQVIETRIMGMPGPKASSHE